MGLLSSAEAYPSTWYSSSNKREAIARPSESKPLFVQLTSSSVFNMVGDKQTRCEFSQSFFGVPQYNLVLVPCSVGSIIDEKVILLVLKGFHLLSINGNPYLWWDSHGQMGHCQDSQLQN